MPVVVSKGVPSLTQVYASFLKIRRAAAVGKRSYLYQFGDHDPTGCLILKVIKLRLNEFCVEHDCPAPIIKRAALTEDQVTHFRLPTRPIKRDGNRHANDFSGDSVELDALPSNELRKLVIDCIKQHISDSDLHILRSAEQSERDFLTSWARDVGGQE